MSHNATTLAIIIDPTTDYVIIGGDFFSVYDATASPATRKGVAGFDSNGQHLSWSADVLAAASPPEMVRTLWIDTFRTPASSPNGVLWVGGVYTFGSPLSDPWGKDFGYYALP